MNQTHRRTPSFSSSLLDAIYRSIDGEESAVSVSVLEETAMIKKQSILTSVVNTDDFMIETTWKEKRCRSRGRAGGSGSVQSKCSSSSDSSSSRGGGSYGGFFSSSSDDAESRNLQRNRAVLGTHKAKSEGGGGGGFTKTKLRVKKIYGELKKVKQPISPGGRIASFLNSIFSSGNGKKVKMCSIGGMNDVSTTERKSKSNSNSNSRSACSSVTSFSSSCLSKTPRKQSNNGGKGKRSVRFYPVSVIVDEDSRPCGHKSIYEDDPGLLPFPVPQKLGKISSSDVVNGERYIRRYQKKKMSEFDFRGFHSYGEDSEDEDGESCSSSDLFELDHLIGIGRLREELPVYETTNFKTNQAIANGFIL